MCNAPYHKSVCHCKVFLSPVLSVSWESKQKRILHNFLNDNFDGNYDDNNKNVIDVMCNNNIPNYIKLMHKLNSTDIMEQLIVVLIPYLEEIGVVPKNLLRPWRYRHYDPPKRRELSKRHSVTSQKICTFSNTAARTSNIAAGIRVLNFYISNKTTPRNTKKQDTLVANFVSNHNWL